jgi:hypothetical protein
VVIETAASEAARAAALLIKAANRTPGTGRPNRAAGTAGQKVLFTILFVAWFMVFPWFQMLRFDVMVLLL